jgi:hypothetical protein
MACALAFGAVVSCGTSSREVQRNEGAGSGGIAGEAGAPGVGAGSGGVSGESGAAGVGNAAGDSGSSGRVIRTDCPPEATGAEGSRDVGVIVTFPPPISYTDAGTILVRGRTFPANHVESVRVDGVEASSDDGFATWRAEVPVRNGTHEHVVGFTTASGEITEEAAAFTIQNHGSAFVQMNALEFAAGGQLVVADRGLDGLFLLDLATERAAPLGVDDPESFLLPPGGDLVALDPAANQALGTSSHEVIGIDLASGERYSISFESDPQLPTGIIFASGMTLDSDAIRAFVLTPRNIVGIDLASGERNVVAEAGFGGGFDGEALDDIVYDNITIPEDPRLLVSDRVHGAIIAVDIATGIGEVLSGPGVGEGDALVAPSRMKLDRTRGRLLVVDGKANPTWIGNHYSNRQSLVAVDLATGDRTVLSGPDVGDGPLPGTPYALALDAEHDLAYLGDHYGGQIFEVDLERGDRTVVFSSALGTGDRFVTPHALLRWPGATQDELIVAEGSRQTFSVLDLATSARRDLAPENSRLYANDFAAAPTAECGRSVIALDGRTSSVVRVDLATGEQDVITSPNVGSGPDIARLDILPGAGLALDTTRGRVLVVNDDTESLIAVDLENGNRTILSDATTGSGPDLGLISGVILDEVSSSRPRALVGVGDGIIAVDLDTGDRELISSVDTGGVSLVYRMVLLPDQSVLALTYQGLFTVDLSTGNGVLISGLNFADDELVGEGPPFEAPMALTVDFERSVAYVSDLSLGGIVAVDLLSGDRVLVSH